jgi:hypothetical protein
MKKIYLLFTLSLALNSCGFNIEQKNYSFDNFRETPLWELAQAVRADNPIEIKGILKGKKINLDLKEPKFQQTLLALAIQNNKRSAFLELLNEGANPNELVGNPKDATPFIYGIENVENCDLYYVESMLQHGANPNLEIKNPQPKYYFTNSFPLLVAIGNQVNRCSALIKLLVDSGADINCCYKQSFSEICGGVITKSLILNDMETLKYFVIEKKITIPDTVIIIGELDKSTQEAFGLREILTSKDYRYEDFERDGKKYDKSQMRKTRDEILKYLEKK